MLVSNSIINSIRRNNNCRTVGSTIIVGTHFKATSMTPLEWEINLDLKGIAGLGKILPAPVAPVVPVVPVVSAPVVPVAKKAFKPVSYLETFNITLKMDADKKPHVSKRWYRVQPYTLRGMTLKALLSSAIQELHKFEREMFSITEVRVNNWILVFERAGMGFAFITLYPTFMDNGEIQSHPEFDENYWRNA